jgi:hypothetical protein
MHFGLDFLLLGNFGRVQTIYTAAVQSYLIIGKTALGGPFNVLLLHHRLFRHLNAV